jgi:lipid II:glycine glycyltransferase (peptidoglycan interpeptide bridge formation enzyme)
VPSVQVIDPRLSPAWDEFVAEQPEGSVFHSAAWAKVLLETYRYQPRYYVLADASGDILAGVPLLLVRSRLTGRRLVGLPFSDLCPPLVRDGSDASPVLDSIRRDAQGDHLSYVEMRGPSPLPLRECGFQEITCFTRHVIPLDKPFEELEAKFHSSARRGMKKAQREGVSVRSATSPEEMRRFYQLYVTTRRKHGVVPAPYGFFEKIQAHLLTAGSGCLLLAEWQDRLIAADLLLWDARRLTYKFNVSDPQFLEQRPNNMLMWEAIQLGKRLGCASFDLGRSEADNEGLHRFKSLWASEASPLPYYYYPTVKGFATEDGTSLKRSVMSIAVRLTPRPLLPRAGALLYRHLG